jgi:hypothetical protein
MDTAWEMKRHLELQHDTEIEGKTTLRVVQLIHDLKHRTSTIPVNHKH